MQIAQEARLIDRHQRPKPHRHRRELPEIGHQPGMGIGGQALAVDLLAEVQQLLLAEPSLQEGARVNARRDMALEIDEIAAVAFARRAPEMREAGVVERRRRLVAGDMAAEFGRFLIGLDDDGDGVPADGVPDRRFHRAVAGVGRLVLRMDRVHIGRVGGERQAGALAARGGDDGLEELVGAIHALERLDGVERVEPFAHLRAIALFRLGHDLSPT
jgi:hypothetical protein